MTLPSAHNRTIPFTKYADTVLGRTMEPASHTVRKCHIISWKVSKKKLFIAQRLYLGIRKVNCMLESFPALSYIVTHSSHSIL